MQDLNNVQPESQQQQLTPISCENDSRFSVSTPIGSSQPHNEIILSTSVSTLSVDSTPSSSYPVSSISYPAPLPKFSPIIEEALRHGTKTQILNIYGDIVNEASRFYIRLMPHDSGAAKQSFENVGRTIVETYPLLAMSDCKISWSFFNGKLSSAIRNMRCRLKRKLVCPSPPASTTAISKKPKDLVIVHKKSKLSEDDYNAKKALLKKEWQKNSSDRPHCQLLLEETFLNRRDWVNSTPSTELRLKHFLGEFPCFNNPDFVFTELSLCIGENRKEFFKGKYKIHSCL